MTQIYDKLYQPVGEATLGHQVFREIDIPAAELTVDVGYVSNDLTVNFQGWSRQGWKVLAIHAGAGAPEIEVEIQEWLPNPTGFNKQNPGLGGDGTWATNAGLGVGLAVPGVLFVHNSEDTMRWARLRLTPRDTVPDGGIRVVIEGKRDN